MGDFTPERRREIVTLYKTGDYGGRAQAAEHFGCTLVQLNDWFVGRNLGHAAEHPSAFHVHCLYGVPW